MQGLPQDLHTGEYTVGIGRLEHAPSGLHASPTATLQPKDSSRLFRLTLAGGLVLPGCEPPRKPAPPMAHKPAEVNPQSFPDTEEGEELLALVDTSILPIPQTVPEVLQQIQPDIREEGDRPLTLGEGAWVKLPDGRQIKKVYSADGAFLFADGTR